MNATENTYPYGAELKIALKLNGCYIKMGAEYGYRKYISVNMDSNPLAQYWIELLPGHRWEARTNIYGNIELLPLLEQAFKSAF